MYSQSEIGVGGQNIEGSPSSGPNKLYKTIVLM